MSTSTLTQARTSEDHRADGYLHVRSPLEARALVGSRVSVHFPDTRWHGKTVRVLGLRGTLWDTSAGFIQWTHDRVRVRTVPADDPMYPATLAQVHSLCPATSAIVAGGWVRDLYNADEPNDVDVFIAADQYDAAIEHAERFTRDTEATLREHVRESDTSEAGVHVSAGESVERVYIVDGLCAWPVQLIEVPDPIAWVSKFDAYCNMLYVSVHGALDIVACASLAIEHATVRIFELNPSAQESSAVLYARMKKFEARGYVVRGALECDDSALLAALDEMGAA